MLAQQNQADALLNLVQYKLYGDKSQCSLTFTAYQGGLTGGSSSISKHNFNPVTATSPNFTQNVASLGVWVFDSRTTAAHTTDIGNNGGGGAAGNSDACDSGYRSKSF